MNHALSNAAPNWVTLTRSEHWVIDREPTRRIIRFGRTSTPIKDVSEAGSEIGGLERVLAPYDVATHSALIDLRAAPMRSDPEFERGMRPIQQRALSGFARTAVLVATAVGRLQVNRTRREEGKTEPSVFQDETEALGYLARPGKR